MLTMLPHKISISVSKVAQKDSTMSTNLTFQWLIEHGDLSIVLLMFHCKHEVLLQNL